MKKIVLTLLGFAALWIGPGCFGQQTVLNIHNSSGADLCGFWIYLYDPRYFYYGTSQRIPAGTTYSWDFSNAARNAANSWGNGLQMGAYNNYWSYCPGPGGGGMPTGVDFDGNGPTETMYTNNTYNVWVWGGGGGGSDGYVNDAPVNFKGCLTITNTSPNMMYGYFQQEMIDSAGIHDTVITPCAVGQYVEIPPGQSLQFCDTSLITTVDNVKRGASVSLDFYQVSGGAPCSPSVGPDIAGNCVTLCNPDGSPFSGSRSFLGAAPEVAVSTNGVGSGPGGSASAGQGYMDTGVLYTATNSPIPFSNTTNAASVSAMGFDALYDVEVKQLNELQRMDNNQLSESAGVMSNATVNANSIGSAVRTNMQALQSTMAGLSNTIAGWGSGSGTSTNAPIIWTEPAGMSNQLGAIQSSTALIVTNMGQLISNNLAQNGYLQDFSNGLGQLTAEVATNAQAANSNIAYLAAISNNTAQPNRYTNVDFGSVFPTNAADIGSLASNQVAGIGASLQSLGDTLNSTADSINGSGPGGSGAIYTVQAKVPGPAGGMVAYSFDMNPMDYPDIVDLAAFVRKVMTWVVGIGFLLKIIGDISAAVGQMMSTAQGQVPRITVLGNTVGWVAAGVYLIGIVAVLIGVPLLVVTYLTSSGFGPSVWSQIQTNPFSSSGYGAAMIGALWLADKFVPLYFVVATTLYYAAFRFYLVRLITIVAAVVRAFMA